MEDLLIALLQGVVEFLGNMLFECIGQFLAQAVLGSFIDLFEWLFKGISYLICSFTEAWPGLSDDTRANWIAFFYFLVGLATGAASLHGYHDVFLRRSALRLMALALGPFLSGCASWMGAKLRLLFQTTVRADYSFWWALFFSLGLCLVRFGFCHRPEM